MTSLPKTDVMTLPCRNFDVNRKFLAHITPSSTGDPRISKKMILKIISNERFHHFT
jgi:hypothetical protein